MEARGLLPSQDGDAYAALRRQQAVECPTHASPELMGELVAVSRRFSARVLSYLWIWGLYVRPHYRGTPASRALVTAALAWCEQQPPEQRLFGAFEVSNVRATRFCQRFGFQRPDEGESILDRPPGCTLVERLREIGFRSSPIA